MRNEKWVFLSSPRLPLFVYFFGLHFYLFCFSFGLSGVDSPLIFCAGDKPHICEYCQKRFALACNLRAHLKTHEGEHQEKCAGCGKTYSITGRLLTRGYCPACLGSVASNGLPLSAKTSNYEAEPPRSPLDSNEDSKSSSRSNPDIGVSTPPPRLLFGVLDQMMLRYRQSAQAFLPPALSAMKFLEGASMLTP